jgi:hypothetical protein
MIFYLGAFLVAFVPLYFQYFISRNYTVPTSDKMYHKLLIELIKLNNNRPILSHKNIINTHLQSYPQLLHWILSYLPIERVEKIDKKIPLIFMSFNLVAFYAILFTFASVLDIESPRFYFITTLLFVVIPYHYNLGNAKNVGLSARGLGVFLGVILAFFLMLFLFKGSWIYYCAAIIVGVIILLSSQFTTQFLLFIICLWGGMIISWEIFVMPFISTLLFFIFFPKLAYVSLKGQYFHKKVYFKYLAERFILRHRKSIWIDIFYDFPRIAFHRLLKDKFNVVKTLRYLMKSQYIRRNSIIIFIIELPIVLLALILGYKIQSPELKICYSFVLSCCIVFFLTSFRQTRFLGEPERYIEYALPFASIIAFVGFPVSMQYILILISIFLILFDLPKRKKDEEKEIPLNLLNNDQSDIRQFLLAQPDVKLLSVSLQDTKFMLDPGISCFYFWINEETNDGFHFTEVFPESFDYIGVDVIFRLINYYKLSHLLINKSIDKKYSIEDIENKAQIKMKKQLENKVYVLYKIEYKV